MPKMTEQEWASTISLAHCSDFGRRRALVLGADVVFVEAIPLVFCVLMIFRGHENAQDPLRLILRHKIGSLPSVFVATVHLVEDNDETHHENY